ncbi:MAG: tryptophan-rich sensory protein [Nanoarchaeota archaeon]|nr:tryptophan-rich sensory protein [Nanoarchaeota archaeon]MBU4124503.1 tryptophan-rich sensory protein [Nanoarchaeota archaeon]
MKINWKLFIISFGSVFLTAFLGSLVTDIGSWYESVKPAITPPGYIFPIVWTTLYIMIGFSIYYALRKNKNIKMIKILFGLNLFLNFLWSFIFFYLHQVALALGEIIILWVSILMLIVTLWKTEKKSAYLLIPYLIWVAIASYLNYLIFIAL